MSLEGDLLLPPKGPLKWRWLSSIIEKIARAASLISPNDSVIIAPTASGLSLRTPGQAAFDAGSAWAASQIGSEWTMRGGDVEVSGIGTYTVPLLRFFNPSVLSFAAIRIDLSLTPAGIALTPRAWEPLSDVTVDSVTLGVVTRTTLEAARSVLPGTRTTGTIYIPIATITPFQQILAYGYTPRVFLYHQYFTVA